MNNQSSYAFKPDKSTQDRAYDLLGDLLLQNETHIMLSEIETEKTTEAEHKMNQ